MPYYISPPPMNPLARLLAALVGVLALVGAFFFGIFIFAIAIALGLIAWLAFTVRVWWLRRKLGFGEAAPDDAARRQPPGEPGQGGGDVIDGEYEVISRDEDR